MKSCLVVDDSKVIRKVARHILEGLDFSVSEAADGREALDACLASTPDVILLDWNMPVMSGMDFLRALRETALPSISPKASLRSFTDKLSSTSDELRASSAVESFPNCSRSKMCPSAFAVRLSSSGQCGEASMGARAPVSSGAASRDASLEDAASAAANLWESSSTLNPWRSLANRVTRSSAASSGTLCAASTISDARLTTLPASSSSLR